MVRRDEPRSGSSVLRSLGVSLGLLALIGGGGLWLRRSYLANQKKQQIEYEQKRAHLIAERARQLMAVGTLREAALELSRAYAMGIRNTPTRLLLPWLTTRLEYEQGSLSHDKEVDLLQYSPDGKLLLTGCRDFSLRVYSRDPAAATQGGRPGALSLRHRLLGHKAHLQGAWFSGDGRRLLSLADDATCRLWDPATGSAVATLSEASGQPWLCRFVGTHDASRALTLANEPAVHLWDGQTGALVATLAGHTLPISIVRSSPDGSRIVTAAGNGAILWDGKTGQRLLSFSGHSENIKDASFSPDGTRLVTTSADQTARLWDGKTGQLVAVLEGHTGTVYSAAFTLAGGKAIMTISADGTARLWDSQSGRSLFPPIGHPRYSQVLALSSDGSRMVIRSESGALELWDRILGSIRGPLTAKDTSLASEGENAGEVVVSFSPNGRRLITGGTDGMVRIWDGRSGQPLIALKGHRSRVLSIAWLPDNSGFATGGSDGVTRLWGSGIGRSPHPLEGHKSEITALAFSPLGSERRRRLLSVSRDGDGRLWDADSGEQIHRFEGPRRSIDQALLSRDGTRAITVVSGGSGPSGRTPCIVKVWDTRSAQLVHSFGEQLDLGRLLAVSPDGDRVLTTPTAAASGLGDAEPVGLLFDLSAQSPTDEGKSERAPIATLRGHGAALSVAAFSADGSLLVTGSDDHSLRIWDGKTGQPLRQIEGHRDSIRAVAFSPDGRRLLSGGADRSARLFDAVQASPLHAFAGQVGSVRSVLFSPDGLQALTVDSGDRAWLWSTASGQLLAALSKATQKSHTAMAFSPDGSRIASAGDELRIYDAQTGQSLLSLDGSGSERAEIMTAIAFSPDGNILASGTQSGAIKVWDVHLEQREPAAVKADLERILSAPN
ncbi:MAG: WD40 repeat domain-containing protein [Myxococcales bacterium]|nr:WD40 repeat domain-containing protein [Myxococcales bacterium]